MNDRPETPCEEWQGPRDRGGYGRRQHDGRTQYIHRWVMATAGHDIAGMVVMHLCDNPPCFRYDHLRVGSIAENQADMVAKGRAARGTDHPHAKLADADVRAIRADPRSHHAIAADYHVDRRTIGRVKTGRTWAHVS